MRFPFSPILISWLFFFGAAHAQGPALDNDGDRLPSRAIVRLGSVQFLHGEAVRALAFLPDAKTVAASSQTSFIRLWDSRTGHELRRLATDRSSVMDFALSPDGALLAAGDNGGNFHVWDTATGKRLHKLTGVKTYFRAAAWSADGAMLLVAETDGYIRQLDPVSGATVRREPVSKTMRSLAFDQAGRVFLYADTDKLIHVWDVNAGKERHRLEGFLDSHDSVAVSRDGARAAATCMTPLSAKSYRSSVRVWDLDTGKTLHELPISSVAALSFSLEGKILVSGHHGGEIRFWDLTTGKKTREWHGRDTRVWCLAWSKAGAVLASGGESQRIRLWDPATGKELTTHTGHAGLVQSVAFSPDGTTIASAGVDRTLRFWDWRGGKELRRRDGVGEHWGLERLVYADEGNSLYAMAKGLPAKVFRRWEPATVQPKLIFGDKATYVSSFTLMPDRETLAAGCHDGTIGIWELTTGKLIRKVGKHKEGLVGMAVSPDGKTFAWASGFQTMGLWDAATGKELLRFKGSHHHSDCFMAFSPDGSMLATSNTGSSNEPVHLWEVATGRSLAQWPHAGGAQAVAFSPDGLLLAACGHEGVVLWDVLARQEIARFKGHEAAVKSVSWAPHGQVIVSGAGDGTMLVWDVTGQCVDGRLPPVKLDVKMFDQLWQALAAPDAAAAHAARWRLAAAEAIAELLAKRLRPIARVEAERLRKLLADLDAADFVVRERATQQLAGLGQAAAPALRKAFAADATAEALDRANQLLQRLAGDAALAERRRSLRAVAILASQGGPAAAQLLGNLAKGAPEAELTQAARAALVRMERQGP